MIRLVIADDHPVVREGLKRLVSENGDMTIVAEAVDATQVLQQLRTTEADVLLLDISMPGGNFLETMRSLRAEFPHVRVLVLSVHPEEIYAIRAFKAGAFGYLTKGHSREELAEAIRAVYHGRKYITTFLADHLLQYHNPAGKASAHEKLTNREHQILALLGAGMRLKDIADELSLSPKTVSAHRSKLLEKLNLKTTGELIRYALEHGISP